MSAVDERLGVIARPEIKPFGQVKKGYTVFAEDDIIFAKITPCMQNGKHAIASNLIDGVGFGSTEFHVLRPTDKIISSLIHYFLRQPSILKAAMGTFTGTVGQQRVPENFLANLKIPLPPTIEEQRRIAAVLDEQMKAIEQARRAVEEQLAATKLLPNAFLRSVFESEDAQKWQKRKLGDVCEVVTGGTPPRGEAKFYGGSIPWIKPDDLDKSIYVEKSTEYLTEEGGKASRLLPEGSVLVSCIGNIGKIAIASTTLATNQQLNSLIPSGNVDSLYLYYSCRFIKPVLISEASISLVSILNKSSFSKIEFPLPETIKEQKKVAEKLNEQMQEVEKLKKTLTEQLEAIKKMPSALLRKAFAGEI